MFHNVVKNNLKILLILTLLAAVTGCGKADSSIAVNYGNDQSSKTAENYATNSESTDIVVSTNLEITENSSLTLTASEDFVSEPVQLSGNFIEDIRTIYEHNIVNANSVEEFESKIEEIDTENRINEVHVYVSPGQFIDNVPLTHENLDLYESQILYVKYDNDSTYITGRPDREGYISNELMISSIIARCDTIEQLIMEFDGWDIDKIMTSISVYRDYSEAWGPQGGDNPTSVIMENGRWVVTEGDWNPDGRIRITYDDGISWFALRHKGEIIG